MKLKQSTLLEPPTVNSDQVCSSNESRNTVIEPILSSINSSQSLSSFNSFFIFICITIILLFALNIYLLIVLHSLDTNQADEIKVNKIRIDGKWSKSIIQQKILHESELMKWKTFLRNELELLQRIQQNYLDSNLRNVHYSLNEEL